MTEKNNNDLYNPRENPFYHWGVSSFTMALIFLTVIPGIVQYYYVFPTKELIIIPASFLIIFAFIAWQNASGTQTYQYVIIGSGLILYSLYNITIGAYNFLMYPALYQQIVTLNERFQNNLILLLLVALTGLLLICSGYNLFKRQIRDSINSNYLLAAILLSLIILVLIIIRNTGSI